MWDTIQKLEYRANAGISEAWAALNTRLTDRILLPLPGIGGEKLYLTGVAALTEKARELNILYEKIPEHHGIQDMILLDAWSSATIEGARTTVAQVKASASAPATKDDRMVLNTIAGSKYAYGRPITSRNIRRLWEKVVDGVCENQEQQGILYRSGMVFVGSDSRVIHTPAAPESIPDFMSRLFAFQSDHRLPLLLNAFIIHFYFVYIHPFCDGNGRTARILNNAQLFHGGYPKVKGLSLSNAINNQLSGYYSSLADSEKVLCRDGEKWLDISPFTSYMTDAFERSLIDAALSENTLSKQESKLLERMDKAGIHAEITVKKASVILSLSDGQTRNILNRLADKGYLSVDDSKVPFIYQLNQHIAVP